MDSDRRGFKNISKNNKFSMNYNKEYDSKYIHYYYYYLVIYLFFFSNLNVNLKKK